MKGAVFGIGNPLLDISAHVDYDYLQKYGLKPGDAIIAQEQHLPIYDEIKTLYKVEYIPGGAAQNTIRIAQWILGVPGASVYVGCVGDDENGQVLRTATEAAGVTTHYLVDPSEATGTCAVLITNKERSLCTRISAASNYKKSHIETPALQEVVERAHLFYSTGYFLTVSPETLIHIGEHALHTNKFFFDQLSSVFPYVDVVFSNEDEAKALGQKQNWGDDLKVIAEKVASWTKLNDKRKRLVIFTQGARNTIVFDNGKVHEFTPLQVAPEEIVDLNGAGDSFVGGFLAGYVQGKTIEQSVKAGHYAASEVIRQSGCTVPEKPSFSFQ